MTDLGYDFYWNVLNSIDYGIPQKRERIYMVCFRKDLILNSTDIMQNKNKTIRIGTVGKGGQGERIYSPKGIAITLSSNGGGIFSKTGGYLVNGKTRKLHPRECARIMGFPDSYMIHPSFNQAYKQFGNSVVVNVLQYIAINIGKALNYEYSFI